jgi:hypothetical protein
MQPKQTTGDAGHSTAKNGQADYGILVSCNKCGGLHEMGISVVMTDGPVVRQSIGALYREKTLPKNLADLTNNSVTCPTTGRQSIQKNNDQIFLVPPKS